MATVVFHYHIIVDFGYNSSYKSTVQGCMRFNVSVYTLHVSLTCDQYSNEGGSFTSQYLGQTPYHPNSTHVDP